MTFIAAPSTTLVIGEGVPSTSRNFISAINQFTECLLMLPAAKVLMLKSHNRRLARADIVQPQYFCVVPLRIDLQEIDPIDIKLLKQSLKRHRSNVFDLDHCLQAWYFGCVLHDNTFLETRDLVKPIGAIRLPLDDIDRDAAVMGRDRRVYEYKGMAKASIIRFES